MKAEQHCAWKFLSLLVLTAYAQWSSAAPILRTIQVHPTNVYINFESHDDGTSLNVGGQLKIPCVNSEYYNLTAATVRVSGGVGGAAWSANLDPQSVIDVGKKWIESPEVAIDENHVVPEVPGFASVTGDQNVPIAVPLFGLVGFGQGEVYNQDFGMTASAICFGQPGSGRFVFVVPPVLTVDYVLQPIGSPPTGSLPSSDSGSAAPFIRTQNATGNVPIPLSVMDQLPEGDTDLNGKIDADDYFNIDSGYSARLSGWAHGDFNFDGVINGDDYAIIDAAYSAEIRPASPVSAVPEPAGLWLLCAAIIACAKRRRRAG